MGLQYVKHNNEWVPILGTSKEFDVITSSMTVNIPTDYATLQAAIDDLSVKPAVRGAVITLNIEAGHQPTSGITVQNGDFSRFKITSSDATFTLGSGFTGTFITTLNAASPVFATNIDMNGLGDYFMRITESSTCYMQSGCEISNSGGGGIYVRASRLRGSYIKITGCADRSLFVTRSSTVSLPEANISGQTGGAYGVYVSRASILDLTTSKVNNMNVSTAALIAIRSRIAFVQAECNYSGAIGIHAAQGGVISAQDTKVMFSTSHNVVATDASTVHCANGDFRYAGQHAIFANGASNICADNCSAPNATGNSVRSTGGSVVSVRSSELRYATDVNKIYVEHGGQVIANGSHTTAAGGLSTTNMNVSSLNAINGSLGIVWG